MKLTDFSRFQLAITALGVPIITAEIGRDLLRGDMDIEREDIIPSPNGLCGLVEREGHFFVTKIILHIVVYSIPFLHKRGNEYALEAFQNDRYDAPELRRELHKYHFSYCTTLKNMFSNNRRRRYKQSHRQDGKFRYMFAENNQVQVDREEQKLNVCGNCLTWLNERRRLALQVELQVDTFLPSEFFEYVDDSEWLPDCGYNPATYTNFVGYPKYFKKICQKIREKRQYRCEQCKIDLSQDGSKKFLHCHHKNADTGDSRIANLSCLCVKCHAEQPMHGHMKQLPDYKEFLPIWESNRQHVWQASQREDIGS